MQESKVTTEVVNEVAPTDNNVIAVNPVKLIDSEAIIELLKTPEAKNKIRVSHCNSRKELEELGLIVTSTIPDAEDGSIKKSKGEHDQFELLTISADRKAELEASGKLELARKHSKNYVTTKKLLRANINKEIKAIEQAIEIAS